MAELLSVQVHAPVTLTSVNATSSPAPAHSSAATATIPVEMEHLKTSADCGGGARRLKKVDNATQDAGTAASSAGVGGTRFDYLPKRQAVNIEFDQLTYSVSEGRKKGRYIYHHSLVLLWFAIFLVV